MIDYLIRPFTYSFMSRALIRDAHRVGGVRVALVLAGAHRLVADGRCPVLHSVLPGVVLAYIVGAPFTSARWCSVSGGRVDRRGPRPRRRIKEDAAIGIVFTTLFAIGLVLISVTPSQTDLNHVVFGNVLGVSRSDLAQIAVLGAIVAVVLLVKRRDLVLFAFDPIHACHRSGPRVLGAVLLGLLALTTVTALQVVGIVLVVAMLVIPGTTAYLLTDKFSRMLVIAPITSML